MKRNLIVVAVAVTIAGLGYLVHRYRRLENPEASGSPPAGDEASASRSRRPAPTPLQSLWAVGIEHEYALEESSSTTAGGQPFMQMSMAGRLFITRLDAESIRYQFDGSLHGSLGPSGDLSQLEAEAKKPFYVTSAGDDLIQLRVEVGVSNNTTQLWRSLLATTRLEWPEHQNAESWRTTETGPLGACLMQYERIGLNEIKKERVSCSVPSGAKVIDFETQQSEQAIVLRGLRIESLSSNEKLKTEAIQGTPSFESATKLSLQYLDSRDRSAELAAWKAAARAAQGMLIGLGPSARPAGPLSREDLLARIGDRTFPGVMTKMLDFEKTGLSRALTSEENAAFGRSFVALRSMLQLNSKYIPEVEKHIEAKGPLTQHLLGALGEAGTPEAQAVLIRYLENSANEARERTLAGIALARLESPTEASVAALRRAQKDPLVADQATFALGSNVKRLAGANQDLRKQVLNGLIDELDRAPSDQKERYLAALGNAAAPEALPKLQQYATSEVASERKNAANGARQIPGPAAEGLLVGLLADPEETVRAQAVAAIADREPSPQLVDALSVVMRSETSYLVRSKAVNGASLWLREMPAVAPALRAVAENDSEEGLRLVAARALEKYGQ
jgi:HEAT repeat protein